MFVFEITKPGTWLDFHDREQSRIFESHIDHLISSFYEANVALNLFINAMASPSNQFSSDQWERDNSRRSEIRRELESNQRVNFDFELSRKLDFEAEVMFKREQWSQGTIPKTFEREPPFLYARAFLFALDSFDKFLKILADETDAPASLSGIHTQFCQKFPELRAVRNSAQHKEDRARGLGVGGKALDLKGMSNNMIHAPNAKVLILNSLNGSRYGNTMADGCYGEVDVSPDSMKELMTILQATISTFSWTGSASHYPR